MIMQYQNQASSLLILTKKHLCCHTVANDFTWRTLQMMHVPLREKSLMSLMKDFLSKSVCMGLE